MSVLTDIWRQMVRRRLWPVAVLLIAALAAVPLLLAKDPEPTVEAAAPAPANAAPEEVDFSESIVTATTTSSRSPGRDVLGKERDIFKSTAKKPKAEKSQDTETPAPDGADTPADTGGSSGGGGATDPQPAPAPDPTTPAEPAPKPKPTYPQHSLKVRFSGAEDGAKGYLPRDTALPSTANPLLVYVGLLEDEKTAVFLVDSTVQAVGDGECHPTPESCETVRMQEGDTMFFDVVDPATGTTGEQYQLDLLDIYKKKGARGSKARRTAALASAASMAGPATAAVGQVGSSLLSLGRTG